MKYWQLTAIMVWLMLWGLFRAVESPNQVDASPYLDLSVDSCPSTIQCCDIIAAGADPSLC